MLALRESNIMAEEQTESKSKEINLDEITAEQALQFITGAVRQLPFTYSEHINLEQCRRTVAEAIA